MNRAIICIRSHFHNIPIERQFADHGWKAHCDPFRRVFCSADFHICNVIEGFSTFSCKKLLNIHDIAVLAKFRGHGLSQHLLRAVEAEAVARGCAKLTLEVLEGNVAARAAYEKFGFGAYQLDPAMGQAMFWQKSLASSGG